MPYLQIEDLKTHIYPENADEISREDDEIIEKAIAAAIDEAKGYMSRFDLLKIFGDDDTEPVVSNENLKNKVKDLVVWTLVKLGNPNIKIDMARTCYEDAIKWFERVATGKFNPGLPMPVDDDTTDYDESGSIQWDSETKRNNHW